MAQTYLRIPQLTEQDISRFWSKVEIKEPNECWPWLRGKDWDGYGCFSIRTDGIKHHYRAHRIAYFLHYQEDPEQLVVRHLICDNPTCCNALHLATGTINDNNQDSVRKGRRATGIKNGRYTHPELIKRGEDVPWTKLTKEDVLQIRFLHAQGIYTYPNLAAMFNVDFTNIYCIVHRKTWKHI